MVHVWTVNETFTHGFLVLPITAWLIWQKKNRLSGLTPTPEPRVFALLLPLLSGWIIASIVDVQVVQQFSMISIIIVCIWIVVGRQALSAVLFPLLFLFFAVPFGQSLIPPLMEFTANFTVALVQLSGIPIFRDGLFFTLPSGSWSVVEECSGVRYLIASLTLGTVYSYLYYSSFRKRSFFILLSILVPIFGNGFRAYGIVMIGHFSGMELAVGADHLVYGWVFFGVIIFLLFYLGSFWWDSVESFSIKDENKGDNRHVKYGNLSVYVLLATILLVILSNLFSNYVKDRKSAEVGLISLNLPDHFSAWKYDENRLLAWQPIFQNPDVEISRTYYLADDLVQLNIGFYRSQRQGAEAISSSNRIASPLGGEWKKVKSSEIEDDGMDFNEIELRNSSDSILVWHWYKIGQYETQNPYIAKAIDAYNLIVKGRTDASIITLATRINGDVEVSRQRIVDFWDVAAGGLNMKLEQSVSQ